MTLIWATRGYAWGFRFLRRGGLADPLLEYEELFSNVNESPETCQSHNGRVALRFPDPRGRKDRAGRIIPHEFVLRGTLAKRVQSVEDGIRIVWPFVEDEYEQVWRSPEPPAPRE